MNFPLASKVVLNDFYVDDLVSGAPTTQEAIQLAKDVTALLKSGCMNLRKWISNDSQVLAPFPRTLLRRRLTPSIQLPSSPPLGLNGSPAPTNAPIRSTYSKKIQQQSVRFSRK